MIRKLHHDLSGLDTKADSESDLIVGLARIFSSSHLNTTSLATCLHAETSRVSIKGDGVNATPMPSNSTTAPLGIRTLAGGNRSSYNVTSGVSQCRRRLGLHQRQHPTRGFLQY